MGLGAGTRRVAIVLQLQPCHPLTGHIPGRLHGAVLHNATTMCVSSLTQGLRALHKCCWSLPVFWQNYCHLFCFSRACRRHWTEPKNICSSSALGSRHIVFTACLLHSLNSLEAKRISLFFLTAWCEVLDPGGLNSFSTDFSGTTLALKYPSSGAYMHEFLWSV